ncbi:MAG TPA: nucleoside monophosphate kinase [Tepidisphaeraceae bacterium]|jgi:adenylate kinase|nr:nucleoside monophosphate kinase [Tepidisphaeraceae bacterium]
MRYKAILLFGAPGSGKGTQGKILGSIPGFYHSATGDIFRSLDLESDMGRRFWEFAARGELVPDEFTIQLWKQYIKGMELINQFHAENEILVLDGIPRNVGQAELLQDTIDVELVVHLHCTDLNKMVERLRRRALRENRFDDASDEVIQRRLMVYDVETKPVLEFYPESKIVRVEATMSQIRVLSELIRILVPLKEEHDHVHSLRIGAAAAARANAAKGAGAVPSGDGKK